MTSDPAILHQSALSKDFRLDAWTLVLLLRSALACDLGE